jgi:hypothetical protein
MALSERQLLSSPTEMRALFRTCQSEIAEIEAQSNPIRVERDRIEADAKQQLAVLDETIRTIEAPLYNKKMELAALARALSGRTGEPK